jgi:NDP-sugar pyrophosphorylase family protein
MARTLTDIDALILCGGLGTRLRPVIAGAPKSLAPIGRKPFIDILIAQLRRNGFRRVILCVGYRGSDIERHFHAAGQGADIVVSKEPRQLGTAGAIRNAMPYVRSADFFVFNGDSFCNADLESCFRRHRARSALATVVAVRKKNNGEFGGLSLGRDGRIAAFAEKSQGKGALYVNAGIYVFNKAVFAAIPAGKKTSLERDILPKLLSKPCFAYITRSSMLDIGTPARYARARRLLSRPLCRGCGR